MKPSRTTPSQKITFSPALKRCAGGSLPTLLNAPPIFSSHLKSPRCGNSSLTKVRKTITSDTANTGPAKLCRFFST